VFRGWGCTGDNPSPDLSWSGAPAETEVVRGDHLGSDAPTGVGFVHWVLFNIPGKASSLPPAPAHAKTRACKRRTARATSACSAYGGPCPPPRDAPHHYHLVVYALDVEQLEGLGRDDVLREVSSSCRASTSSRRARSWASTPGRRLSRHLASRRRRRRARAGRAPRRAPVAGSCPAQGVASTASGVDQREPHGRRRSRRPADPPTPASAAHSAGAGEVRWAPAGAPALERRRFERRRERHGRGARAPRCEHRDRVKARFR